MVFINIYRQPFYQNVKAELFSLAPLVQLFIFCAVVGVPIALVAINPGEQLLNFIPIFQLTVVNLLQILGRCM